MKRLVPLLLLVAGCARLPQDTDGTLARIRASHHLRVGVVAADWRDHGPIVQALIDRIARATSAVPAVRRDAAAPLLVDLERGGIDVVIGIWDRSAPPRPALSLAPIIDRPAGLDGRLEVRAAVRSGENRWAMLVERESRALANAGRHE